MHARLLLGVDFTSAPTRRKPIVVARLVDEGATLALLDLERVTSFDAFERCLRDPDGFVGGFDFPFGLPRAFLESAPDLPRTWSASMAWLARSERAELRARFRAYCDARPPGSKFAHRRTDLVSLSSPSMKWVNPPVAFMMKEGAPRLLAAGCEIPGLSPGDPARVALEAYPAVLARVVVGRASYKSDEAAKQDRARAERRRAIVDALVAGRLAAPLRLSEALRTMAEEDARGDVLDAILCAVQASIAVRRPAYGIPEDVDPLEGWIVGGDEAP